MGPTISLDHYFRLYQDIKENYAASEIYQKIGAGVDPFNFLYLHTPFYNFFLEQYRQGNMAYPDSLFGDEVFVNFTLSLEQGHLAFIKLGKERGTSLADMLINGDFTSMDDFFCQAYQDVGIAAAEPLFSAKGDPQDNLVHLMKCAGLALEQYQIIFKAAKQLGLTDRLGEQLARLKQAYDLCRVVIKEMENAAGSSSPNPSILEKIQPLVKYTLIYGIPFIKGYETYAYCPADLATILLLDTQLTLDTLTDLESKLAPDKNKTIIGWYNANLKTPVNTLQVSTPETFVEALFHQNYNWLQGLYPNGILGEYGSYLSQWMQLGEIQSCFMLACILNGAILNEIRTIIQSGKYASFRFSPGTSLVSSPASGSMLSSPAQGNANVYIPLGQIPSEAEIDFVIKMLKLNESLGDTQKGGH